MGDDSRSLYLVSKQEVGDEPILVQIVNPVPPIVTGKQIGRAHV